MNNNNNNKYLKRIFPSRYVVDAVSSSEMETASESVDQHLAIKCTQLVRRQGNNQLQYETYCAQLEVVVQTSPWSLF